MKNYKTIQKPEITIVGITCRTSNSPDAGPQDIPKLWERFFAESIVDQIPNKASSEIMALYCDYEEDHTKPYSIIIGCPVTFVEDLPSNLVAKTVPATSYALFSAVGEHPQSLIETWGRIWSTDLKRSYAGDLEVYGVKFSKRPQEVEILIAL